MSLRTRIKQFAMREIEVAVASQALTGVVADERIAGNNPTTKPVTQEATDQPPHLTELERKYRKDILDKLLTLMDLTKIGDMPKDDAKRQLAELTHATLQEENVPLNVDSRKKITQEILDEILGLGPLELLLRDPTVCDIMVNGAHCVYVERGGRLQRSPVSFDDNAHLMRIVDRIVSRVGRRIDESVPMVDARLEDGSRVNVIIPPLALDGPVISIRRFPSDPLKLNDLCRFGALSQAMADLLSASVKAGKNILISGGTGSGKTTTLNALSAFIPDTERIVTIEDAAELQLQQSHVVRLETRPPNIEGKGEYTARDLVKNALRMRPDRIVVGEVRGQEALDMLQAMNTGHDGSITTVHANTARDSLARIENMVAMAGYDLPPKAVRAQIASAIHMVIQVQRLEDGSRRMTSISEVVGMEGDVITMAELFQFQRDGITAEGRILGDFKATGVVPTFMDELRRKGIYLDLDAFDPLAQYPVETR